MKQFANMQFYLQIIHNQSEGRNAMRTTALERWKWLKPGRYTLYNQIIHIEEEAGKGSLECHSRYILQFWTDILRALKSTTNLYWNSFSIKDNHHVAIKYINQILNILLHTKLHHKVH
jgi:hypothetical protein